jgi:hypothetical protein
MPQHRRSVCKHLQIGFPLVLQYMNGSEGFAVLVDPALPVWYVDLLLTLPRPQLLLPPLPVSLVQPTLPPPRPSVIAGVCGMSYFRSM